MGLLPSIGWSRRAFKQRTKLPWYYLKAASFEQGGREGPFEGDGADFIDV